MKKPKPDLIEVIIGDYLIANARNASDNVNNIEAFFKISQNSKDFFEPCQKGCARTEQSLTACQYTILNYEVNI